MHAVDANLTFAANYPFMELSCRKSAYTPSKNKKVVQHHFHHQSDSMSSFVNHQPRAPEKRKKSKPIQVKRLQRSASDDELYAKEMVAEHRDIGMYLRIVDGMMMGNSNGSTISDPSLANVVRTRHAYNTVSDANVVRTRHAYNTVSDFDCCHDDQEKKCFSTTPVLCRTPLLGAPSMQLAPTMPLDTTITRVPRPSARYAADAFGCGCSGDEIFHLDL
jgi:hypothetical protein